MAIRSRNSLRPIRVRTISILVLGPMIVAAAFIEIIGPSFEHRDSRFTLNESADAIILDNGSTALVTDRTGH